MHQKPYNFFMLRRAAMPTSVLTSLHNQCGDDFQKWEAALLDLYRREPFGQAIYIASPSLFAAADGYDKKAPEKSRRKVLFSLYKYLIRMSSRATPFGLFSVIGVGHLSKRSKLSGPAIHQVKKTIKLQISALTQISSWLEKQQLPGRQPMYIANSSLHQTPTEYRYIEPLKSNQTLAHMISAVQCFPELTLLIEAARTPKTKNELADILHDTYAPDQAIKLIDDMIDSGILLSELSVNATGQDFQDRIKAYLDECSHESAEAQRLHQLICGLSRKDSTSALLDTAKELTGIVAALSAQQLFGAQLSSLANGLSLDKKVVAKLAADFATVKGLLRSSQQLGALQKLKENFRQHYGQRTVPLCELLENEMGTKYAGLAMQAGSPPTLLRDLEFIPSSYSSASPETAGSRIKQQLLDRALSQQLYQIEILESDLKTLPEPSGEQSGFYWLGEMLSASAKEIDCGHFQFFLKAAGGQTGLELMARFAQDDPLLASRLRDATRELVEKDKENIHAEIAHMPDPKAGAVLSRPHLWPYEIPYLSYSVVPTSRQIAIDDIMVSVSEQDHFVLTSKSLLKKIIPHNTTAHNYSQGLPIYQFLSDVANQHSTAMAWDWEQLRDFSFLPRVVFGQLILSPAQWNFSGESRQKILNVLDHQEHCQQLRDRLRLPRLIQIGQGDNQLLIDLDNCFARGLLKAEIQKNDHLQIQEYLQSDTYKPVEDQRQRFAHELVLAFKPCAPQLPIRLPLPSQQQRLFPLGSCWLYLKIFLPVSKSDQLLTTTLARICAQLTSEGQLEKWFYVRYFDPSHHLRIRLMLTAQDCWHLVLARLQSALESSPCKGLIEKIQTDTYERELERYQSLSIEKVESIFYKDSVGCVKVISLLEAEPDDQQRWHAALYAVDTMLDDFGLSIKQRADFARANYQSFLSEFGQDQAFTWQLDRSYRHHRGQIRQILSGQALLAGLLEGYFKERSEQIRQLRAAAIPTAEISSYVHMCLNRILESNHRKQEMILFHFLAKYYQSAAKFCTN